MDALELIAERKLAEAVAAGEFERLPGSGKPLALDDLSGAERQDPPFAAGQMSQSHP